MPKQLGTTVDFAKSPTVQGVPLQIAVVTDAAQVAALANGAIYIDETTSVSGLSLGTTTGTALDGGTPVLVIGSNAWLRQAALAQAFLLTGGETYDTTYGTLTASNITWPDGTTGAYATTSLDANGAVLGFTVTYVGTLTKTVTVTVPRNASSQVSGTMTATVA